MTRCEFTDRLRTALSGEIPTSVVEEHIRFYDRYISDEIAKGKREEEVLAALGDARLIAKTILETWRSDDTDLEYHGGDAGQTRDPYGAQAERYGSADSQGTYRTTTIYEETYEEDGSRSSGQNGGNFFGMNGKVYRLDKWYLKLIPIAIVLLILAFVFLMFFGMMKLAIMILTSPVFWGIILVTMIWGWFSRRR